MYINPITQEYCGFSSEGHAEQAKQGNDIVCAGVSTAVFGAYYNILYNTEAKFSISKSDGKLHLMLDEPNHEAMLTFRYLNVMIDMISASKEGRGKVISKTKLK